MNGDPTKRIRRKPDPEESRIAGLALLRLRRQTGMTVGQLSARSGNRWAALNRYEQGQSVPRTKGSLRRVPAARPRHAESAA